MKTRLQYALLTTAILLSPTLLYSEVETTSADLPLATHEEVETIEIKFENLTTFCMDREGNLLACDSKAKEIRKISPAGKPLAKWKFNFAPNAIHASANPPASPRPSGMFSYVSAPAGVFVPGRPLFGLTVNSVSPTSSQRTFEDAVSD
jgi:hypothetical protein